MYRSLAEDGDFPVISNTRRGNRRNITNHNSSRNNNRTSNPSVQPIATPTLDPGINTRNDNTSSTVAELADSNRDADDVMGILRRLGGIMGSNSEAKCKIGFEYQSCQILMLHIASKWQSILKILRNPDPFIQLEALNQLNEILVIATEDMMGGFPATSICTELASVLTMEHNPEIMLIGCRTVSNMLEAYPATIMSVMNSGLVPLLCAKLLNIDYMDVAEQALSVRFPQNTVPLSDNFLDFTEDLLRDAGNYTQRMSIECVSYVSGLLSYRSVLYFF